MLLKEHENERFEVRGDTIRTFVYQWRCLLMSQKDVMLETMVKKPHIIHPTW